MSADSSLQDYVARQPQINQRRRILRPALYHLLSLLMKLDVTGLERIPASGPVILMINHISIMDPAVFTALSKRFVISIAKAEAMDHWLQRNIIHLWGNFVINRGEVDRNALNNAIELLKNHQLLLIAPEGTRNPHGMQEAKSGTAYIAYKSNAVIVPAAICGAQDFSKRWQRLQRAFARVHFGKPFRLRLPEGERFSRQVREAMIQEAMYQLALTIPDDYAQSRGYYRDVQQATTKYIAFVDS